MVLCLRTVLTTRTITPASCWCGAAGTFSSATVLAPEAPTVPTLLCLCKLLLFIKGGGKEVFVHQYFFPISPYLLSQTTRITKIKVWVLRNLGVQPDNQVYFDDREIDPSFAFHVLTDP